MALSTPSTTLPPSYVYKSLPTSPATIRLIKIHNETSSFDDPINCEIHHVSLDAASGYGYTGLSYVWGEPIFDQTIHCDGCVIKVTSHLHEAIRSLRSRRVSWVWIDAICIDQSNIAERNAQVSIMGRIFKQTKMTFAYLGEMGEDGEQVAGLIIRLAFLNSLLQGRSWGELQLLKDTDSDELVLEAALQNYPYASEHDRTWFSQWRHYCMTIFELRETISREEAGRVLQVLGLPAANSRLWSRSGDLVANSPWFKRGWVMQEAMLSPYIRFLFGGGTVDLEDIAHSSRFSSASGLNYVGIERSGPFGYMPGVLMTFRDKERPRELMQLLRIFRECKTSDPRDKIYSLLGVAEDLDSAAPKPDYHQSEEDVFSSYARYLIQHQHQANLDILIDAGIARGSTRRAGTWVPRWDKSLQYPSISFGPVCHNTSGSTRSAFSFGDPSSLLVRAVIHDQVSDFMAGMSVDESWYTWERKTSDWVQDSPGFSAESYAKALVMDFFGHGMKFYQNKPATEFLSFNDLREHALAGRHLVTEGRLYMQISENFLPTHAFVLTHKGNMGWVPRGTEPGDLICIVFGVRMPLVVRAIEHGKYILIGAAYIEGIMQGEVFEGTNVKGEDITLV